MAKDKSIYRPKMLKSNTGSKYTNKMTDFQKYSELIRQIRKGERKQNRYIKEPSDNFFIDLNIINFHTPLDMKDDALIDTEASDNKFVFYKESYITPIMIDTKK
jgi:7,8-dihydro-6-hydroxymethylpterin-pyrophosphokinase